jgi:hypothetical protein
MLCPVCHGQRLVLIGGRQEPCAECGGLGTLHCCEGLVEQPDCEKSGDEDAGVNAPT